MLERGDILEANNRDRNARYHFIIFYAGKNEDHFLGGMLTKSSEYKENIPMNRDHFKIKDLDQNTYKVTYKNSFLVPAKLMKLESWKPFQKVGKLTKTGIAFIESKIDHLEPMVWEDYLEWRKINL